jgi:peroxiredoxin
MAQFEPLAEEIKSIGVQVVYIAAEKREGMHKPVKYLTKHPVSFPFLLDEDRSVAKAYGLYHRIGLDAINIAHPATLVIDRGGVVRYVYRGRNQLDRAPLEQVLNVARQLRDSGHG